MQTGNQAHPGTGLRGELFHPRGRVSELGVGQFVGDDELQLRVGLGQREDAPAYVDMAADVRKCVDFRRIQLVEPDRLARLGSTRRQVLEESLEPPDIGGIVPGRMPSGDQPVQLVSERAAVGRRESA